ncbi:MAG: hypothetical protein P8M68_02675 [Aquiluna sp.]|nr:hypothetical protein [Aquiluna sp.]
MKSYFSFKPEHFNNNGDQGNIDVIGHFADLQNVDLVKTDVLENADFVLFGDASQAAMKHYEDDLGDFVESLKLRLENGLPTLLVGSCFELFWPLLTGVGFERSARVSEFRSVSSEAGVILGYRNSTVSNDDFIINRGFVGTTFFGPVLSINPELLNRILLEMKLEPARWTGQEQALVERVRSDFTDG